MARVIVLLAGTVAWSRGAGGADVGGVNFAPTSPTIPWLSVPPAPLSLCASDAWLASNGLPPGALLSPVHAVALDATRVMGVGLALGCDPLVLPPSTSPMWLPCARGMRGVVSLSTQGGASWSDFRCVASNPDAARLDAAIVAFPAVDAVSDAERQAAVAQATGVSLPPCRLVCLVGGFMLPQSGVLPPRPVPSVTCSNDDGATWWPGPSLPFAVTHATTVAAGAFIYLIPGVGAPIHAGEVGSRLWRLRARSLTCSIDTAAEWEEGPVPLPFAPRMRPLAAGVNFGERFQDTATGTVFDGWHVYFGGGVPVPSPSPTPSATPSPSPSRSPAPTPSISPGAIAPQDPGDPPNWGGGTGEGTGDGTGMGSGVDKTNTGGGAIATPPTDLYVLANASASTMSWLNSTITLLLSQLPPQAPPANGVGSGPFFMHLVVAQGSILGTSNTTLGPVGAGEFGSQLGMIGNSWSGGSGSGLGRVQRRPVLFMVSGGSLYVSAYAGLRWTQVSDKGD